MGALAVGQCSRCSKCCDQERAPIEGETKLVQQISTSSKSSPRKPSAALFGQQDVADTHRLVHGSLTSSQDSLMSLSYQPPPPSASRRDVETLLGRPVPPRPQNIVSSAAQASSPDSATPRESTPSCARPGEPPNKVYVQFSNDLEGFLPYTLLISEEHGLEFTSLSGSPDFGLDPLFFLEIVRVRFEVLMEDRFFLSLSRSVIARPDLHARPADIRAVVALDGHGDWKDCHMEERVRPPYRSLVQVSVRRAVVEGGQVLVFMAVQSEPLADELTNSCRKLRKRRVSRAQHHYGVDDYAHPPTCGSGCGSSRSLTPTRGCPTPRTVASRTPPALTPPSVTSQRELTPPPQGPLRLVQMPRPPPPAPPSSHRHHGPEAVDDASPPPPHLFA